jgi:hypothetical protein
MRWKPSLFLCKYRALLDQNRCLLLAHSTIHNIFERERISCKQLTKIAFEQDPELQLDFQYCITQHQAHQLLCCNKMSKNNLNYAHLTGCAPLGQQAKEDSEFTRKKRFLVLGGIALDQGIVAAKVVEGLFTTELFEEWIVNDVVRVDLLTIFLLTHCCSLATGHQPFPRTLQCHCP